jgi:hypothetical protein
VDFDNRHLPGTMKHLRTDYSGICRENAFRPLPATNDLSAKAGDLDAPTQGGMRN